MSPVLSTVINRIIEREGVVFTQIPGDRGGATKFGVTVPFYTTVMGRTMTIEDVANLTLDEARALYHQWLVTNRVDEITDLHVLDAFVDYAVHSGLRPAVKALQRALDVPADGLLGSVTLSALADADQPTVVRWITGQRLRKIGMLLASDVTQSRFVRGWLNRIADVLEAT